MAKISILINQRLFENDIFYHVLYHIFITYVCTTKAQNFRIAYAQLYEYILAF